jgi:hypothetical protein
LSDDVLIAVPPGAAPVGAVWGSDGEQAPADEALDWVTLCRLLGWGVEVRPVREPATIDVADRRIVIVAGEAGLIRPPAGGGPGLIVRRRGGPTVTGTRLTWTGPGAAGAWSLARPLAAHALVLERGEGAWATLDGAAVIAARREGAVVEASLGLDPSTTRREAGAVTALLKRLLTDGAPAPACWLELAATLVIRMDDPGASASVHLRAWSYPKLDEAAWAELTQALWLRGARMTVAYTPGWVDDGDAERGELRVVGRVVSRHPGAVHPSPLVRHLDITGHAPGRVTDHEAEFRGIRALREAGAGDVELHGHTHLRPDLQGWAAAPDRYEEIAWFREFDDEAEAVIRARDGPHPLELGVELIAQHFATMPTTLVCPSQAWTTGALDSALASGFELVTADGLAIRDDERFCWCVGIPVVYLDGADPTLLEGELPVIGVFHDRDPAVFGTGWVTQHLDRWLAAGARRLVDFRELAALLGLRLELREGPTGWELAARPTRGIRPPRPVEVMLRFPGAVPRELKAVTPQGRHSVRVQELDGGLARTVIPAFNNLG